ncbi:MAG: Wzz/FepE/Etk N-terminal domain-containing protein, partial [Sedimentisphaerales bacterium]
MANLENGTSGSQPVPNDVPKSPGFEDEINLIDYFRVLWQYKWLIVLGSVLPALIVGLAFFFSPRSYEVTYVYDVSEWNLNEKNYNILINRFYSEENLNKIINKLRENGLNEHAELIRNAGNSLGALKNLLKFEPVPSYIDLSKVKVTEPERLVQIRKLTAQLLNMTIVGNPKEDLLKIASVVSGNLENVVPVYWAEEQLNATIRRHRARMADIEENRFELELALKTNGTILTKLKNIRAGTSDKTEGRITLQFDVGGRSEYLP